MDDDHMETQSSVLGCHAYWSWQPCLIETKMTNAIPLSLGLTFSLATYWTAPTSYLLLSVSPPIYPPTLLM